MASSKRCTLYIGVTFDLAARVSEQKSKSNPKAFTAQYDCNRLVYFERFDRITDALDREKQLKHWKRQWKIELIEKTNSDWIDLPLDWTVYQP